MREGRWRWRAGAAMGRGLEEEGDEEEIEYEKICNVRGSTSGETMRVDIYVLEAGEGVDTEDIN